MQAMTMQARKWIAGGALALAIGGGAMAWQDATVAARADSPTSSAAPAAAKMATIDLFRCLQTYMQRPEMTAARDAQNAQFAATNAEILSRIQNNQNKLKILPQGDPQFAVTQQAVQADSQEFSAFRQQMGLDSQALAVAQSTEAFIAVHAKSAELAMQLGYTHLVSAKLDVADLMNENGPTVKSTSQMIQELLARPVLFAPEGDDITVRLLEALDILQYEVDEADETGATDGVGVLPPAPGGG